MPARSRFLGLSCRIPLLLRETFPCHRSFIQRMFCGKIGRLPFFSSIDRSDPSGFYSGMKRTGAIIFLMIAMIATGFGAERPRLLEKASVLPLALDDHFQFLKFKMFLNDPKTFQTTNNAMINFERERVNYKAVTEADRQQLFGQYFTFFWRTTRQADLTVRLEYRQENLGSYVQAREVSLKDVKGSRTTEFDILGDDYIEDGRITAWRALLIENGRIVGLTQSYLWN